MSKDHPSSPSVESEPKRLKLSASAPEQAVKGWGRQELKERAEKHKLFEKVQRCHTELRIFADRLLGGSYVLHDDITVCCTEIAGTMCDNVAEITPPKNWLDKLQSIGPDVNEHELRELLQSLFSCAAWEMLRPLTLIEPIILQATKKNLDWVESCHAMPLLGLETRSDALYFDLQPILPFGREDELKAMLERCMTEARDMLDSLQDAYAQCFPWPAPPFRPGVSARYIQYSTRLEVKYQLENFWQDVHRTRSMSSEMLGMSPDDMESAKEIYWMALTVFMKSADEWKSKLGSLEQDSIHFGRRVRCGEL